ncbi:arginine biosynthesis protein ArgJ [Lipomyces kononenkoae]|uniref:Arginine biosynthesis protein ArgJ n=1 Tax=Lipomyces kononenkoae TaxID=34357 RepID=A0ACC3TB03_LIPKO
MTRKSIIDSFRAVIAPVRQYSTKRKVPDKTRFIPTSGTYPEGFIVSGTHVGVKKRPDALDLALIFSEKPCSAAAVFTKNVFKAAPVQVSKLILENTSGSGLTGIIANSGCANAVTGEGGIEDAWSMSAALDLSVLGTKPEENESKALVMSTGVIGQRLPIGDIINGVPNGVTVGRKDHESWMNAARAFCTTDTFPKLMSKEFMVNGIAYRVAGLAKGAGMIHPNMATLLGCFVTDAPVSPDALSSILKFAVDRSFNSISVDGDMSTNDTIAALANGAAGGALIDAGSEGYEVLKSEITSFAESLAQLVVRDGEGATKFVTINVEDAESFEDAKKVASTIATSSLVKTALYGEDANWGRITCAIGYSDVNVNPLKTSVSFVPVDGSEELKLLINGEPENVDEDRASQILANEDLVIRVQLGTGGGQSARMWTCDLSHEYVTINGDYRS